MRRHAKASSAGSSSGGRNPLGTFSLGFAVGLVVLMAISPSAFAAITHPYTGVSFGPDGTEGTAFSLVQSVAVDQGSGDVYVYDGKEGINGGEGGKIYKFDAAGNPVNFSALSGNVIEGVGRAPEAENEIAIAPPGSPGGTAGDIYVANNSVVKIFAPSGAEIGELTGGETCGVATNAAGHVFVGVYPNEVREYVPTSNPPTNADQSGASSGVAELVCNVAADGLGNVYAARYYGGVQKLEGLADPSASLIDPSAPTLGIDPATNDLYADRESEIRQYDSAGKLRGRFGKGQLSGSRGVAVNENSGEVYVGNGEPRRVEVFGSSIIVPGVTAEPVSGLTSTRAILNASVNPDGVAVTECKFEYGPSTSYGNAAPCEGAIPTDSSDHPVTAALSGLEGATFYHFRVSVTNANGTNKTDDQTFETSQPAFAQPATEVTGSTATLNGVVRPEGEAVTECFFEFGRTREYGDTAPCEGAIPSDEGEHAVTAQLAHLRPNGALYHFRLVIKRASGVFRSEDLRFTTAAAVVTGAASSITPPTATVEGTINPEGLQPTDCSFEYGITDAYGNTAPCAESPASIGEGTTPVTVHGELTGLTFGTTYHYRLTAANAEGTIKGQDETLHTPGAVIEAQWAASVDLTEALLKARINPEGSPTTFHLEYGTDASYGNSTPEEEVGSDGEGHTVSNNLTGLTPHTTYHYRYVATNAVGVSEGPDQTFITTSPSTSESACPNQQFRVGASARLPDCRAYEMVSPIEKNNTDINWLINLNNALVRLDQSSADGEKLTYTTSQGFGNTGGTPYASQYLATRSSTGWNTDSITPSQGFSRQTPGLRIDLEYQVFSDDLCVSLLNHYTDPPLAPGALEEVANIYRRTNCGPTQYETVSTVPYPGARTEFPPEIQGLSANGRCSLFAQAGARNLYEVCAGQLQQVNFLPNGEASHNAIAGTLNDSGASLESTLRFGNFQNAISADGSRIYWTPKAGTAPLYVRENAQAPQSAIGSGNACLEPDKACTTAVSDKSAEAHFWGASPDGARAFYTVLQNNGEISLYEFNLDAKASKLIASELAGGLMGVNQEATRIYFVSREELSGHGVAGKRNLYLFDSTKSGGAQFQFVGTVTEQDTSGGAGSALYLTQPSPYRRVARLSPDGLHAVFSAYAPLTGYDNTDAVSGERDLEVFTYDASGNGGEGSLHCVSCNPTGQRPVGRNVEVEQNHLSDPNWAAALVPGQDTSFYGSKAISDDGSHVFFNSYDSLLPADTNGKEDVYEWQAPGAEAGPGKCTEESPSYSPPNGGCLSLISSGESPSDSEFLDASPQGRDVFFTTAASLLPQDPGLIDIYDARSGGGYPPPPIRAAACEGEACQGAYAPPNDPTPASSSFEGAGNVHETSTGRCAKGKARRKGRCVAKKSKHAAKKHAKKGQVGRTTKHNGRAAR